MWRIEPKSPFDRALTECHEIFCFERVAVNTGNAKRVQEAEGEKLQRKQGNLRRSRNGTGRQRKGAVLAGAASGRGQSGVTSPRPHLIKGEGEVEGCRGLSVAMRPLSVEM